MKPGVRQPPLLLHAKHQAPSTTQTTPRFSNTGADDSPDSFLLDETERRGSAACEQAVAARLAHPAETNELNSKTTSFFLIKLQSCASEEFIVN